MTIPQDTQDIQTALGGGESVGAAACEFNAPPPHAGRALRAYDDQMRRRREDDLIIQYLPLVHRIVRQIASYLQPPLSRDDLISAGTIGLVKAARDYDAAKDAEFKTYAYIRIRGAVIDEMRGWSFTPTTSKKLFDQVQTVAERYLQEHGTIASDEYIAETLNLPLEKIYQVYESARARHFLSISGADDESPALGRCLTAPNSHAPGDRLEHEEMKTMLARAIEELPEKQRHIILLYYHRELTMKQVSDVMELTESRISQLHAAALFKLSTRMKQWQHDEPVKTEQKPEIKRSH
ncbi:MAG TPA: FliA/WhiG family RNA polymerase sigma factor [Phycisphaerales bacterium]|nr:FliA/WhiG family RNA polymerase sigma factor [Phycisphaerales bacterium]